MNPQDKHRAPLRPYPSSNEQGSTSHLHPQQSEPLYQSPHLQPSPNQHAQGSARGHVPAHHPHMDQPLHHRPQGPLHHPPYPPQPQEGYYPPPPRGQQQHLHYNHEQGGAAPAKPRNAFVLILVALGWTVMLWFITLITAGAIAGSFAGAMNPENSTQAGAEAGEKIGQLIGEPALLVALTASIILTALGKLPGSRHQAQPRPHRTPPRSHH